MRLGPRSPLAVQSGGDKRIADRADASESLRELVTQVVARRKSTGSRIAHLRLPAVVPDEHLFSGRSSATSGTDCITGVPASELPKITTLVSRSSSPARRVSPLWLTIAKSFSPRASTSSLSLATVSFTEPLAVFVTTV